MSVCDPKRTSGGVLAKALTRKWSCLSVLGDFMAFGANFWCQFFALMWVCSFELGSSACLVARFWLPL